MTRAESDSRRRPEDPASAERWMRRRSRWFFKEVALVGLIAVGILLLEWGTMVAEEIVHRRTPWVMPTTDAATVGPRGGQPQKGRQPIAGTSSDLVNQEAKPWDTKRVLVPASPAKTAGPAQRQKPVGGDPAEMLLKGTLEDK